MGVPQKHNAAAWSDYRALLDRIERFENQAARTCGVSYAGPYLAAFPREEVAENGFPEDEIRAAWMCADLYMASDVPRRLTDLLADPTLAPPRLSRDGAPDFSTLLDPAVQDTRMLVDFEHARLYRALRDGDDAVALECVSNVHKLARLIEACPIFLTASIARRQSEPMTDVLTTALHRGLVSLSLAEELIAELQRAALDESARLARAFEGEEIKFSRSMELLYAGEMADEFYDDMPPRMMWASRADVVRINQQFVDDTMRYFNEGRHTNEPTFWRDYAGDPQTAIGRAKAAPLLMYMSNGVDIVRDVFVAQTIRAMLLVGLAVVVHEDRHGTPPASLDDLVTSGILDEVPRDPFACDGRLVYERNADAPLGYRLYSFGPDRTDNGGRFEEYPTRPSSFDYTPHMHDHQWTPFEPATTP